MRDWRVQVTITSIVERSVNEARKGAEGTGGEDRKMVSRGWFASRLARLFSTRSISAGAPCNGRGSPARLLINLFRAKAGENGDRG